jgi:predicted pyridoxine 5'-phosphate oxidase superfamily flavin-nucleotide-binding protein
MEKTFQNKFGHPIERTKGKVRSYMAPWIQDFIRHSPFCVMATSNAGGDCDASPKGGIPGFVKVLNDRQLFIPDVAGNKLFHSYGNVESNPNIALIFLIPGHNSTVRINGRVKVIDRSELKNAKREVFDPDERAEVLQGLLLDVEESYSHCPRALKFSRLWDVDEISKNIATPPVGVKEPGI